MGRVRKVNPEVALDLALSAFWVTGYKALGVRKLEELSGINRFALQTEFGGKNGLFTKVLDTYATHWDNNALKIIRAGNLDELADFFVQRVKKNVRMESNNGCLVMNTVSESSDHTPEVREQIEEILDRVQNTFSIALHNEKAQGTLNASVNINEASQMLLNALIGMNIYIRMKGSNEAALPTAIGLKTTIMNWRICA